MVKLFHELVQEKVRYRAENGENPELGRAWLNPKPIKYSRFIEVSSSVDATLDDFITVKVGPKIVMEIAEVTIRGQKRFYRTA
jgi:hypothetical protein